MPTIHIDEGQPENGWWRVSFTLSDGEFSNKTLEAVKQATNGVGCFDGGRRNILSVVYYRYPHHPRTAWTTLRALKKQYPETRFTTYSRSTSDLFGEEVEQITYQAR